jgi:hypothetical protein
MSLTQVVEWLNGNHIVSLYRKENENYFFYQKYIKNVDITSVGEKTIILQNEWANLMNDDEWKWYLLNETFSLLESGYCSIDDLKNKIHTEKKQYYTIE